MNEHPIEGLMDVTLEKIKSMVDSNTIIGNPINMPDGCRFHPRCPYCTDRCKTEKPQLREIAPGRFVSCHRPLGCAAAEGEV